VRVSVPGFVENCSTIFCGANKLIVRESVRSIVFVSLVYINHFKVKLFWIFVESIIPQLVHKISAKFAAFLKGK